MFTHMKLNYIYQPYSDLAAVIMITQELILKTLGHIIVDGSSGKICIFANLLLPESKEQLLIYLYVPKYQHSNTEYIC